MSWYSPAVKVAKVSSCFVFYRADIAPALLLRFVVRIASRSPDVLPSDDVCSLAKHLGKCDERETALISDGLV
jgi:hypothetical protein